MLLAILFIVSCALTLLSFRKKRDLENQGREKEFAYYFSSNSFDFFVPFTFVLLLYVGLLAYISFSSESLSLQSLIRMEEFLANLQATFNRYIRLSVEKVFIIVVLLYLLSLLRIPFQKTYRPFSKFRRIVRIVYVFIALLCSFTLFGAQPGAPTENLQFRIKTIRAGYADVLQQTGEAISEEAASKLFNKVHDGFPADYQKALTSVGEVGKQIPSLQQYYGSAQTGHAVKLAKVESTLGVLLSRREAASKLKTELQVTEGAASKNPSDTEQSTYRITEGTASKNLTVTEQAISQVSYKQVKEARSAVEKYRQNIQAKAIIFLNTEEGKALSLRLQKVLTGKLSKALFSSWVEAYPILGPITERFVIATLSNDLQTRREQATSKAAEAIMRNPESTQRIFADESSRLVDQTTIELPPAVLGNANNVAKQANNDLASIENCKAQIDAEIKRAESDEIRGLIAQLRSPNETVRETAVHRLAAKGNNVGQAQVNELVNIMRRGNQTWSKFLRREHHCQWFEYTSVKYYAADAIVRIGSPHVNSEIVREAQTCKSNSKTEKRVTDPGWI